MSERNAKGLAPATGPATGQADMVSRQAVIEMLAAESMAEAFSHFMIDPDLFRRLIDKVKSL